MPTYLIGKKEAQGDDYIHAIDALPDESGQCIQVGPPGDDFLAICTFPGGVLVTHERPDGSSWAVRGVLTKDRVKELVGSYLSGGDDWREGLEWEQEALTSREYRRRTVRILSIGAVLVALAFLLVRLFTK